MQTITEPRQPAAAQAEAIFDSAGQLQLLEDAAEDYALIMLDGGGQVVSWNSGAERLLGYSAAEMLGQHLGRLYGPEDRGQAEPERGLALAANTGRYQDEGWCWRHDGSRLWVSAVITPVYDHRRQLIGFAHVVHDLTQRRLAEDALRRSQDGAGLLLDSVVDYAIFMLDAQGRIVTCNSAAERMKGYRAAEMIGQHYSIFYPPEDLAWDKPGYEFNIAATEGRCEDEGWRVRKDGSRFWANVIITALRDSGGQLAGFAKVTRDLSARKAAELQLAESNAQLRALSERLEGLREEERRHVAYEIHEEFGHGLAALKIELSRLRQAAQAGVPVADRIEGLGRLVDNLVNDVRRLAAALRPAVLDDFGLFAAVEWQLQDFQRRTGIRYQLQSQPVETQLDGSRAIAVFRVFQETLTNIERHAHATCVDVTLGQDGRGFVLRVQDNGRGINPRELQDPASLGLLSMRERVRLMAGELSISGQPGQGTRVIVRLPLADSAAVTPPTDNLAPPA